MLCWTFEAVIRRWTLEAGILRWIEVVNQHWTSGVEMQLLILKVELLHLTWEAEVLRWTLLVEIRLLISEGWIQR